MTHEERFNAIERELAAIRDARRTEAYIHTKALPGLAQAMYELETAIETANRKQAHLAEQFGTATEWLAAHTQAIAEHNHAIAEHNQAIAELRAQARAAEERGNHVDARIEKLVSAIGQLLSR